MTRLAYRTRLVVTVLVAVAGAVIRRTARGPRLPTWTWTEEVFVAASRAALTAGARDIALMTPRRGGLKVPLGREARAALTVEDVELHGVRAERYCPNTSVSGTILYLHGGGFVAGGVGTERRPAAARAMASNCDTYSIDYRLAPEHPYPAALDDDDRRLPGGARTRRGPGDDGRLRRIGGRLPGPELVAEDPRPRPSAPAGAVLLWPYADFTFSGETILTNADIDMLPVRDLAHVWGPAYVGRADPADPLVSPALADLTGLPPLLIIAGGAESLLSCAERIASNARRVGVEARLTVYPEKVHGWMVLPKLPATVEAVAEIR